MTVTVTVAAASAAAAAAAAAMDALRVVSDSDSDDASDHGVTAGPRMMTRISDRHSGWHHVISDRASRSPPGPSPSQVRDS